MAYRNILQSTTGVAPCELLLGRCMHTRLDLLKPGVTENVEHCQTQKSYLTTV